MSKVIDFPIGGARSRTNSADAEAPRQPAARKSRRNSLRKPCNAVDHAVRLSGQLERGDEVWHRLDVLGALQRGIDAARHLSVELEKVLARYEKAPHVPAPPRAPSSQERGDALLMRWRVERAAGVLPGDRLSGDDPQ